MFFSSWNWSISGLFYLGPVPRISSGVLSLYTVTPCLGTPVPRPLFSSIGRNSFSSEEVCLGYVCLGHVCQHGLVNHGPAWPPLEENVQMIDASCVAGKLGIVGRVRDCLCSVCWSIEFFQRTSVRKVTGRLKPFL